MEQLALKFPSGFKARLRAVAIPGESMTATIIRAVETLERPGVPTAGEARDAIWIRLDDLDARVRAIETGGIRPERRGVLTDLDHARLEHEGGGDAPAPSDVLVGTPAPSDVLVDAPAPTAAVDAPAPSDVLVDAPAPTAAVETIADGKPARTYPLEVWARALALRDTGMSAKEAHAQLVEEFGGAPAEGNLFVRAKERARKIG